MSLLEALPAMVGTPSAQRSFFVRVCFGPSPSQETWLQGPVAGSPYEQLLSEAGPTGAAFANQ